MKLTKIILYLLTVLALISAIGLGVLAMIATVCCGRSSNQSQYYLFGGLAIGAVLTAILLQIGGIGLKILSKQDVKRELRWAARIITLLIFVLVAVWVIFLSGNPLFFLLVIGIVVVVIIQWW